MIPLRIACVWIPDLPVWAFRKQDPALAGLALAIGGVPPERGYVTALSPEARRGGLHIGMTLTEAQAILPETHFLTPDDEFVEQEARALGEQLLSFTPKLERARSDLFFLDLRGLERLTKWQSKTPGAWEIALARSIHAKMQTRGYPASIGIADTRAIAEIAAKEARGAPLAVPVRGAREFLAPRPLHRLPFKEKLFEELRTLGLATIGEFAALPTETIASRFGGEAQKLHGLARGRDETLLNPSEVETGFEIEIELGEPLDGLEALTFHLKSALSELCEGLARERLSASALGIIMTLENRARVSSTVRLTRPAIDSQLMLDHLRMVLASETLPSRITAFLLTALETTAATTEQLQLFVTRKSDRVALEQGLTRARLLLGPESVVTPCRNDSHRPERQISWQPYAAPAEDRPRKRKRRGAKRQTDRVAEPPPPVWGELDRFPARLLAEPVVVNLRIVRGRLDSFASDLAGGRIETADGPHRIVGDWWGSAYDRDYYTVTLKSGDRYWLFRDRSAREWRLHGFFD